MKKSLIIALILSLGAFGSRATFATAPLSVNLVVANLRSNSPCVEISVENHDGIDAVLKEGQIPWLAFWLYIKKNNQTLETDLKVPATVSRNMRPYFVGAKQTVQLVDPTATNNPYCIAISHWGYGRLSPGTYQMRIADTSHYRDDITRTGGLRSSIINFVI